MKVKVETKKVFTPITLTITIESEDELKNLWNRSNLTTIKENDYFKNNPFNIYDMEMILPTLPLYCELNSLCEKLDLFQPQWSDKKRT